MAKAKKTKKVEEVKIEDKTQELEGTISLSQETYDECEWCFQFDEDEPQVFAWTDDLLNKTEDPKVIFTVTNGKNSYISFTNNSKSFRIFARQLSEAGKELRENQRASFKASQTDLENFDQKMEEYASEHKKA